MYSHHCNLFKLHQLLSDQNFLFYLFTENYMILVSPVHPVAEGDSVTLGCKLRTEDVLSNVDFYKNGKLIQNEFWINKLVPAVTCQPNCNFFRKN